MVWSSYSASITSFNFYWRCLFRGCPDTLWSLHFFGFLFLLVNTTPQVRCGLGLHFEFCFFPHFPSDSTSSASARHTTRSTCWCRFGQSPGLFAHVYDKGEALEMVAHSFVHIMGEVRQRVALFKIDDVAKQHEVLGDDGVYEPSHLLGFGGDNAFKLFEQQCPREIVRDLVLNSCRRTLFSNLLLLLLWFSSLPSSVFSQPHPSNRCHFVGTLILRRRH